MGGSRTGMIRINFFGTPEYVRPIAEALHKNFRDKLGEGGVVCAVTQSPKPAGRGGKIEYSEIDHWAHRNNITKVYNPSEVGEADLGVVASYGKIIPKEVIQKHKFGILNIHPSLLPKFRGASPVQATIASGETSTGLSVIKMDEKMDHGPIVSSFKQEVDMNQTSGELIELMFRKSADFIVGLIPSYIENKINIKPQDDSQATYTKLISKKDAFINPVYLNKLIIGDKVAEKLSLEFIKDFEEEITSESICRLIRAMQPWPAAWTTIKIADKEKRLKILKAHISDNKLILDKVQLEGKNEVSWEQFQQGYKEAKFEELNS